MTRFEKSAESSIAPRGPCRIIGVSGGSGSGKTTFVRLLQKRLGETACAVLSQDHYYIDQSARFHGDGEDVNFDHPDALDFKLLAEHLRSLRLGQAIEVPVYDYVTHKRKPETERFQAVPLVILDGTLILSQPAIREQVDISVFIDTPEKIRLERRLRRDTIERGRTEDGVMKQFTRQVKPMHDAFVEPSKTFATHVASGMEAFELKLAEWVSLLS
jgi:uridine kinase